MTTVIGRNKNALPINHNIFDTWTNENAWALGLLTGDGSFNKGEVKLPVSFAYICVIVLQ